MCLICWIGTEKQVIAQVVISIEMSTILMLSKYEFLKIIGSSAQREFDYSSKLRHRLKDSYTVLFHQFISLGQLTTMCLSCHNTNWITPPDG